MTKEDAVSDFLFSDEPEEQISHHEVQGTWKVLVVDDEPEVHAVTKLALSDFSFQDKRLEFINAYSGKEAKQKILDHPDTAIVLLDVVMESDDAGLQVARFIREEAKNNHVRIILRTGQPGQAPERHVIVNYDINDYKSKTELTSQKLFTVMMASLRSYRDILAIEQSRQGLEKIILASRDIFSAHSMEQFIVGVMQQLTSLLGNVEEAMYATSLVAGSESESDKLRVLAGQGEFESLRGQAIEQIPDPKLQAAFAEAMQNKAIVYKDDYLVAYCRSRYTKGSLLYISGIPKALTDTQRRLIDLFTQNVQVAYENVQLQVEIEDTQREVVFRLSEAVERYGSRAGNHVRRIASISYLLAKACGLEEVDAEILKYAAPLHDVGKVALPESVLQKPGPLSSDEFEQVKPHAQLGYDILKDSKRNIIQAGAVLARDHHERWDGKGYPAGKSGESIHIFGRIVALADVYDALRHKLIYKEAWSKEQSIAELQAQAGKQFDPKLVALFIQHIDEIEAILQQYPDN